MLLFGRTKKVTWWFIYSVVKEALDGDADEETTMKIIYKVHCEIVKSKSKEEDHKPDRVKKTFLQWSKDIASTARKFLKFVSKMEGLEVKDLTLDMFWCPVRITGWKLFWQIKKCKGNTKHNQLKNLSCLLRSFMQNVNFTSKLNEIQRGYE